MNNIRNWFATTWNLTFARYLVVGVANTAFSYGVYAMALHSGLSYPMASLVSLIAGIILSFKTQGTFVFRNDDPKLFGRFILSWLLIYLINISLIGLFTYTGLNALIAGALALPFNVGVGFLLQRYFVFGKVAGSSGMDD